MIRIRHVVQTPGNSAPAGLRHEFELAQDSIKRALKNRNASDPIDVVAAHLHGEQPIDGPWTSFVELPRSSMTISPAIGNKQLPFMADIFNAFGNPDDFDFGILTNADIMLHPFFYDVILELIERDSGSKSITRRSVYPDAVNVRGEDYSHYPSTSHPGHDCFVIPSKFISELKMEDILLGAQFSDIPIVWSLRMLDSQFRIHGDLFLTYHLGDERAPVEGAMRAYAMHNLEACRKIIGELKKEHPNSTVESLKHVTRLGRGGNESELFKESPKAEYAPPPRRPGFRGLPRIVFAQHYGAVQKVALSTLVQKNKAVLTKVIEEPGSNSDSRYPGDAVDHLVLLREISNSMRDTQILFDARGHFSQNLGELAFAGFDHEILHVLNFQSCSIDQICEYLDSTDAPIEVAVNAVLSQQMQTHQLRRSSPFVTWIDIPASRAGKVAITYAGRNSFDLKINVPRNQTIRRCEKRKDFNWLKIGQLLGAANATFMDLTLCQRCMKELNLLIDP